MLSSRMAATPLLGHHPVDRRVPDRKRAGNTWTAESRRSRRTGGFASSPFSTLAPELCVRLTQIDHERETVLAIEPGGPGGGFVRGRGAPRCRSGLRACRVRDPGSERARKVTIGFPISTFVALDLEHLVANMYVVPAALFQGFMSQSRACDAGQHHRRQCFVLGSHQDAVNPGAVSLICRLRAQASRRLLVAPSHDVSSENGTRSLYACHVA
jgi:hypothetical protein